MLRIDDLQLFVRTADSGSLSAAARGLDVSPAVASAALKRLEASLGARLFVRSTRSLRLTAEGEAYLLHARAALASLHEGAQALAGGREAISGVLQLSAPSDFGRNVLLPWLDEFQASHPQLQVRLLLGDGLTDLFRQPVDLGPALRRAAGFEPGSAAGGGWQSPGAVRFAGLPAAPRRAAATGRAGRAQLPALHARRARA